MDAFSLRPQTVHLAGKGKLSFKGGGCYEGDFQHDEIQVLQWGKRRTHTLLSIIMTFVNVHVLSRSL
jgi:hypothetical protein